MEVGSNRRVPVVEGNSQLTAEAAGTDQLELTGTSPCFVQEVGRMEVDWWS